MHEDFVSFELAKKLREKGFQERSIAYYDNFGVFRFNECTCMSDDCIIDIAGLMWCHNNKTGSTYIDAPTIAQVLKWFREKKGILIAIDVFKDYTSELVGWGYNIVLIDKYEVCHHCCNFDNYEQSAVDGIEYVIDELI